MLEPLQGRGPGAPVCEALSLLAHLAPGTPHLPASTSPGPGEEPPKSSHETLKGSAPWKELEFGQGRTLTLLPLRFSFARISTLGQTLKG